MPPVRAALWRSLRAHQVYGANTDVGKTIVSTVLCNTVQRREAERAAFLKPVSTGPLDDADDRHIQRHAAGTLTKCLYQFDEPVSPHIAARQKNFTVPRDDDILGSVHNTLSEWARTGISFALVETAGGVHSPGPNGNSQADLYRPLRLPVVLVADSRLGGISSSISAYESLLLRGYDVRSVLLFRDDYYKNHEYLRDYFRNKCIPLVPLPQPPTRPQSQDERARAQDEEAMAGYYQQVAQETDVHGLLDELAARNTERIDRLESMASRAHDTIWYPFTQHHGMTAKDITVIDSAHDDYFQTFVPGDQSNQQGQLQPTFDGSASWWTQGLGHGNPELALSAAYAAGRYGHVMFAGNVHEPALSLAELLIETLENPRLHKVFYTDNGSTGMEVAIKMGLRAACDRYGWDASKEQISILGLKGSYHGDTIGVMDCSEPSTYNQKVEWYRGRGYWFDFPLVKLSQGTWKVEIPEVLRGALGADLEFTSLNSVFDVESRVKSDAGKRYSEFIYKTIEDLVQRHGMKFGSLIMEPIILGAGGMLFCDPLFQRCLVDVVRSHPELFSSNPRKNNSNITAEKYWSGLPVIFDEVFTGLYRLGRKSSASFLDVHPDIAVNAKLLTGGVVPLCTTLASQEIFEAFSSPEKSDALLHGHSYTAHAVGCTVAVDSLQAMMKMENNGTWDEYRRDWKPQSLSKTAKVTGEDDCPEVWSVWSHDLLRDLSYAESVESIFAIGTVLSISLKDAQGGGYTSTAAQGLRQRLSAGGPRFNVHSRVLGNVLYLMSSVTSKTESLREVEGLLRSALL
ncbi:adenosylmethionine-8-amino-7-oxononanoate aminotransferase [Aspergillus clavatus NRRL 1]|uniref:Onanonoxo-7-onima-8-eninoihtemlysoneda n=1 Tax=Aspergillus clavatus (strain ATCC 1007 / CBS 513.65 / DSM 816 / NCTC 3887 / NRRL 1 / QM 1276 / 107) TaxID=344612 RepID=A1CMH0_ASPCL|nr:onanonoxo-7-onima-8-eninoihtemlysoneda [Aspergillus clavatus NRRL 1]EAW08757.1 onanonoxo-7-onima-8-eninoihtemlysoneda [Aspergillus clavatus NRRL 1]